MYNGDISRIQIAPISRKIVKGTDSYGNLNFNRATRSTDESSVRRSWHSRAVYGFHYSGQYYYYVDGSLCCSKRASPKKLLLFSPWTGVPFFVLFVLLSPFPLYLPRFKGVVLKRKRRVVLRISLQFLLLFFFSLTLLSPSLPPSLSLSLSLSLPDSSGVYREIQFKKECSLNFIRAPRRHKSRVPMSNIFHRRSRLGRSTAGYLHISPVPGSPKGRYSFLRENLSPSYLLYYRKNLRRQRTSTTCILIGKKARNISVRPSFRERNKNSNEKSCKRERARERERERERGIRARQRAQSSVPARRYCTLCIIHPCSSTPSMRRP